MTFRPQSEGIPNFKEKRKIADSEKFHCQAAEYQSYPPPLAINKTDAVSEVEITALEKSLFYLALTRAQKGAYTTSSGRKAEFLSGNYNRREGATG